MNSASNALAVAHAGVPIIAQDEVRADVTLGAKHMNLDPGTLHTIWCSSSILLICCINVGLVKAASTVDTFEVVSSDCCLVVVVVVEAMRLK